MAKPLPPEQVDHASRLLGRRQYPSVVVAELMKAHKVSDRTARSLVKQAQDDAYAGLRGDPGAADPLVACALFYQSIMGCELERTSDRIQAAAGLVRLLGLKRLVDRLGGSDVDDLLAAMAGRVQARTLPLPETGGVES